MNNLIKPNTKELVDYIMNILDAGKAFDILSIDLTNISNFAESMIIASGTSSRHIISLADELTQKLKELDIDGIGVEGRETGDWVLVDAHNIVVNLFKPEVREHYRLEELWERTSKK